MSVPLYTDHHVPRQIVEGLRLRDVDVLTAAEDDASTLPDPELLDRATALGRVLFSRDRDFLIEGQRRQSQGVPFAGVIYAHQLRVSIGTCINDLEMIAKASDPADLADRVTYLPF